MSIRKFLFQRSNRILSGRGRKGEMNKFPYGGSLFGASKNVLELFILIEIFGNSIIFQNFENFINSLETLKISR